MSFQLCVSSKTFNTPIVIPKKASDTLATFQKDIIRHISNCYIKNFTGTILNFDLNMQFENAVSLALNALQKASNSHLPNIVICSQTSYFQWFYFLKKYSGQQIVEYNETNVKLISTCKESMILVTTEEDFKAGRAHLKDANFFCVIIDPVNDFIQKLFVKQISALFCIGITYSNFHLVRNQLTQWNIIKWAIGKSMFKNIEEFIEHDNLYHNAKVEPYTDFWLTLRWDYAPIMKKPSERDIDEYHYNLIEWAQSAGLSKAAILTQTAPHNPRKRKQLGTASQTATTTRRKTNASLANDSSDEGSNIPERSIHMSPKKARLLKTKSFSAIDPIANSQILDCTEKSCKSIKQIHSDSLITLCTSSNCENFVEIMAEFSKDIKRKSFKRNLVLTNNGDCYNTTDMDSRNITDSYESADSLKLHI